MAINDDCHVVHSGSHALRVTDKFSGTVHGRQVDIVAVAGVSHASLHLEMGHGNGSVGALEGASSIMHLDVSGLFLVEVVAAATSFLQIALLGGGRTLVGGNHEGRKVGWRSGNFHRSLKEFIGAGGTSNCFIPNAIGCCGNDSQPLSVASFIVASFQIGVG